MVPHLALRLYKSRILTHDFELYCVALAVSLDVGRHARVVARLALPDRLKGERLVADYYTQLLVVLNYLVL